MSKIKILFLCTGNSCRSQMAEGWAWYLKSDLIEPYSAGIEIHGLNQNAVKVMAEVGVDISKQYSKHLDELKDIQFDWVITVCDNANESCPFFRARKTVSRQFRRSAKAREKRQNRGRGAYALPSCAGDEYNEDVYS